MAFSGSIDELISLAAEHATSEDSMRELSGKVLDAIKSDYKAKASGGQDSNGMSWAPTARGPEIMIDTGKLFNNISVRSSGGEVVVYVDPAVVPYADFALSCRPAWPEDGTIPPTWKKIIDEHMIEKFVGYLQKNAK